MSSGHRMALFVVAALAGAAAPTRGVAQRSNENAVTSASDAFGNTIGSESIGLYGVTDVRGFSPVAAGNLRLDGLYFDQLEFLNPRLFERRVIRVGPSAQGYPFPAPTGIVDHFLRLPGERRVLSIVADGNTASGGGVEVDGKLPLGGTLGVAGGGSWRRDSDYPHGDYADAATLGAVGRWRPSAAFEIEAFAGRIANRQDRTTPYIFAGGSRLPPVLYRGYLGQSWAAWHTNLDNIGLAGRAAFGAWQLRAGAFRHVITPERGFDVLFLDTDSAGTGTLVVNADPPQQWSYNSGEVRLSRPFLAGQWRHTMHLSLRGGERERSFGGSSTTDFGRFSIGERPRVAEPGFVFGQQSHEHTRQWATGVAYSGQWAGRGEVGFGLQKDWYHKSAAIPGAATVKTNADPWLWNATVAVTLSGGVVAYGGYTRGLEESAVAPGNAINRNQAPPALLTSQRDLGVVFRLHSEIRLIVGAFDVRKPYFNLDTGSVFRELGRVRHRGLEFSASGPVAPGLSVIAGAMLLRPRIEGEAVDQRIIGPRPVGQTERVLRLNLDYRPPALQQFSVDVAVTSTGSRVVSADNRLVEPGHTTLDLGGRYRLQFGGSPVTLRLLVTNLANENGWNVATSGGLRPLVPRRASLSLTADL